MAVSLCGVMGVLQCDACCCMVHDVFVVCCELVVRGVVLLRCCVYFCVWCGGCVVVSGVGVWRLLVLCDVMVCG